MSPKSTAVLVGALLLVASVAPAVAAEGDFAVSATQDDDGSATVTVTQNDTAIEDASVVVSVNESDENVTYDGAGGYTTDENGTVDLPAPDENVTIDVLAEYDNATASTTTTLTVAASDEPELETFGARVSWFVHRLISDSDDGTGIGQAVAEFVLKHNPGNAPDHAGPPADARGSSPAANGTAPYGQGTGGERGPPAHASANDE